MNQLPRLADFSSGAVAHKGIETLIEAWRRVDPALRTRACLLFVGGDTHSEPRTRSLVEEASHENIGVKTLGWQDNMEACYSGMDMLVLPSWSNVASAPETGSDQDLAQAAICSW